MKKEAAAKVVASEAISRRKRGGGLMEEEEDSTEPIQVYVSSKHPVLFGQVVIQVEYFETVARSLRTRKKFPH